MVYGKQSQREENKMNIPCNKYFDGKVVSITGAGGVLCGVFVLLKE